MQLQALKRQLVNDFQKVRGQKEAIAATKRSDVVDLGSVDGIIRKRIQDLHYEIMRWNNEHQMTPAQQQEVRRLRDEMTAKKNRFIALCDRAIADLKVKTMEEELKFLNGEN
mgnify:CR=1 FL=1